MNAILPRTPVRRSQPDLSVACGNLGVGEVSPAVGDARKLRVLVVDDCALQRLLTTVLLSRFGILPRLANDGLEAVLLAGESQFDLILMDIDMPVLDGVTATARIRANERRSGLAAVPIVAYTGGRIEVNASAWAHAGISASLAKPCGTDDMVRCLTDWCGGRTEQLHH